MSRHRQLLMTDFVINESTVNEAAAGLFRATGELDLLRRQRQGENSPGKLPGSHGPQRGPGRVRDGVSPDMLRSAVVTRDLCSWTSWKGRQRPHDLYAFRRASAWSVP